MVGPGEMRREGKGGEGGGWEGMGLARERLWRIDILTFINDDSVAVEREYALLPSTCILLKGGLRLAT